MSPVTQARRLPRLVLWLLAFLALAGTLAAATTLGFLL
jgi:hypothetical protein